MMRKYSIYFLFLQNMKCAAAGSVVLLLLILQNVVAAVIMGDLRSGWHYLVTEISARDLQPTRMPRQIIGSR